MTIDENHRARVSRNAIPVVLGLIVLAALVAPTPAAAQLETLLSPTLGQVMPRTDYRFTFYPEQDVEGQHTTMSVQEHRWSLTTPIKQDSTNEWTASTSLRYQRNDTRAVLPIANEPFPSELWDVRVGGGYRHQFENGWSGGLSLNAGTASDQPFNSVDELIVRGFAHLRVPWGERDSWIFMLTYSNYSEFLGGVPVPGLAYVYSPSDQFTAVIGLPFAMLEWKPIEQVELQVIYTAIRRIRARATYRPFLPLRIYAGFDWDYDFYLRADRHERDDMLFYYEKRFTAGARFDLRHFGVDFYGGYAFDRFFFEGEGWNERDHNRVNVGNGPFLVGRINVRF